MRGWVGERTPVVLLDASVIYSRVLRDFLLYFAQLGVIHVRWSHRILDEMSTHLMKNHPNFDAVSADRLITAMNRAFPSANVSITESFEKLPRDFPLPDERDRHVIEAALASLADVLCTNNLKDFPPEMMRAYGR